jgi:hypothetical protein
VASVSETVKVVRATLEFLPAIAALADKVDIQKLSEEQRCAGFLIPYSESQYRTFVNHAEHFYVLAAANKLIGFVLAHTSEQIDLFGRKIGLSGREEVYDYIARLIREPFIVVRQICVDPGYPTKNNYGRKLYEELLVHIRRAKVPHPFAVGFIWERPWHNCRSEKFHQDLGWKKIDTYALTDSEGVVGIWQLKL